MFLQNKYTKWYMRIITQAKLDVNNRLEGYFEKHHVIPKACGGENSDIIKLTAREHFICHLLLVKMLEGSFRHKMASAAHCMMYLRKDQRNLKINSRTFQFLKEEHAKAISTLLKDVPKSEIHRQHISDSLTGLEKSEAHCQNLSKVAKVRVSNENYVNPWAGERGSEMSSRKNKERVALGTNPWAGERGSENSKRICAAQIERGTHPFQDKKKASERTLKQLENGTHMTQVIHVCPHCKKSGTGRTMFRWHFKNCKLKLKNT